MNDIYWLNIEKAVLSAILFDNTELNKLLGFLQPKDFYLPANQKIFEAMLLLHAEDYPIDETFILKRTDRKEVSEVAIVEILSANAISNIEVYAKEIKEYANKRELIKVSNDIKTLTTEDKNNSEYIKQNIKQKLDDVDDGLIRLETLSDVTQRVNNKPHVPKFLTGVDAIDKNMGGFSEGSFINIAGGNFSGKTTLTLEILKNIAEFNKTVFFSYEMYENLLIKNKFKEASQTVRNNILIEQKQNELYHVIRVIRAMSKEGVKFFAIDSRMKIRVNLELQDHQKASLISSELAKLSQELGVVILLIQQIALTDLRNGKLSFKASGDMEYDSDVNLFITRDEKTEQRFLRCTKDRINETVWQEEITNHKYRSNSKEPTITEYNMIDIPDI